MNTFPQAVPSRMRQTAVLFIDQRINSYLMAKVVDKMVIFDSDHTLIDGHFIDRFIDAYNIKTELHKPDTSVSGEFIRSREFAKAMKGKRISDTIAVVDSIPLVKDVCSVIQRLKSNGVVVGLISESFDTVVNHIKNKVGADFSFGYELGQLNGIITGDLIAPPFYFNNQKSICKHALCKTNTLQYVLTQYRISIDNTIVVGGNENDICIVRNAGIGVSFRSGNSLLNLAADKRIDDRSLKELFDLA